MPDRSVPYLSSSVELQGLAGPTPSTAQYTAPSAGLYCSAGVPMSFPGNLSPARPHVQALDSQMPYHLVILIGHLVSVDIICSLITIGLTIPVVLDNVLCDGIILVGAYLCLNSSC